MNQTTTRYNVAFVSHSPRLTGSAMSFYTLLSGLDKARFQCCALLPEVGPLEQQLQKEGYEVALVPFGRFAKWMALARAKAFLRQQQVHLVYLTCAHKYTRIVAKAAHALGIPVVWHVREPPKGHRVQKSIPIMQRVGARVVVVSQEQASVLSKALSVTKVDNGVDTRRFDANMCADAIRRLYGLSEYDYVFGIVGTLEKRKNTELFLHAARQIAETHAHARFLVVGTGAPNDVSALREQVAASEALSKATIFTGSLWNIPEVMACLDALVLPSNWEAFPRVVIEAMTMKTAVIASDVGDVSDMLDQGHCGHVVPPKDLPAFTQKMADCIEHPETARQMADRAYDKAMKKYTQQTHVATLQRIFLEAVGQPHTLSAKAVASGTENNLVKS